MKNAFSGFLIFALLFTACSNMPDSSALVETQAVTSDKKLVLVGGGLKDDNAAIYNKIIELAGGRGVAKIGVITAASLPESQDPDRGTAQASNSRANGQFYANLLKSTYGALDAQWIAIDLDSISNNNSAAVVNQINGMTGFFFGGGDQSRLITCFFLTNRAPSSALTAILNKYAAGALVAGSSAGTAIQNPAPMITGGESYNGLRYGSYSSVSSSNPDDLSYDAQGGFGLFKYGLIDTHFSERGRQGRIVRLASDRSKTMAYGVDENTALIVRNADTTSANMQIVGQNGVFIFDLSAATRGTGTNWSISNVKTTYLTDGDSWNPSNKTSSIASFKTALAGRELYASATTPTRDVFSSPNNSGSAGRRNPREFVRIANDLFDSRSTMTTGQTYETTPIFEVKLSKVSNLGSAGYQGRRNNVSYYSFKNLRVDMYKY